MKTCPSGDQWAPMLTVDRPVTQIVETAVNRASASGVARPDDAAAGRDRSAVNSRISDVKISTAKRAGDDVVKSRTRSRKRSRAAAIRRREAERAVSDVIRRPFRAYSRSATRTRVMVLRSAPH
ncbi:MAG: hypothetical protein K0Q58_1466 [Microbacterium sp.]|nr:hypothetical protein [Microbacterium sp.]